MKELRSVYLGIAMAAAAMPAAHASPPLIYEGTLTNGGQPPDPWPGLRFSVVDADGAAWWSTLVEPDGPLIEVGPDGRFVAYLEDSPQNPWALAGFDQGRWLRVEVCPGAWPENPADDCQWVQLEQTQRLGTVPMAETVSEAERARIRADVLAEALVQPDVPGGDVATLRVSQTGDPGTFPNVQAALASIDHLLIPPNIDVEVRIEPAGEPYMTDEPIVVRRIDGDQISILGDPPEPGSFDRVVLQFPQSGGLEIDTGARLRLVDGVTLSGNRQVGRSVNGVTIRNGARVTLGSDVIVENFSDDCIDVYNASLYARGVTARGCGNRGFIVGYDGFIWARDATGENNGGPNFEAYVGGGIYTRGVTSDNGAAEFNIVGDAAWIEP